MTTSKLKRQYGKPSIQEAIVEARFSYDSSDSALAGQVFEKIRDKYPKKKNLEIITLVLGAAEQANKTPLPPQAPVMQAWKDDGSSLLQVGPGIAVANQLKYTSWESFIPGIELIVGSYITSAEPRFLTRLGVRYINRFVVPDENVNIGDYFQIGIGIPSTISTLEGFDLTFLNKRSVSQREFSLRTKFSSDALRAGETGNAFLLDIDCFLNCEASPDLKELLTLATAAHDCVEDVFESVLLPRTRSLMELKS